MIPTMTEKKLSIDERHSSPAGYQLRPEKPCTRCGGLMVQEICPDLFNSTSEVECAARRCVQCGDIIDSVILQNRCRPTQSMTARHH